MNGEDRNAKLADYRRRIADLRREMRALRSAAEPEEVQDYEFATLQGPIRLSGLFGGKRDLIVIHNMGVSCPYCTLWADGYNGIYGHLAERATFVISSPDPPHVQRAFAEQRGWRFPMATWLPLRERWLVPGISVFRMDGERILRVSDASCKIGDDFCTLWHLFDLLPEGAEGFRPKIHYA
jgi:predicted dithiol-disulfide oxidoreductase (DUF899 family)